MHRQIKNKLLIRKLKESNKNKLHIVQKVKNIFSIPTKTNSY